MLNQCIDEDPDLCRQAAIAWVKRMDIDLRGRAVRVMMLTSFIETSACPLSSSERQVAVLHPVVRPATDLLFVRVAQFGYCCLIRS